MVLVRLGESSREVIAVAQAWAEVLIVRTGVPVEACLKLTLQPHSCCPTWRDVAPGSNCVSKFQHSGRLPLTLSASDIGSDMIAVC